MAGYAAKFPAVRQYQGLEVSLVKPTHVNWFGPRITMPTFAKPQPVADPDPAAGLAVVKMIQSTGGLASYNHPFGTAHPAELPARRPGRTPRGGRQDRSRRPGHGL